LNAGGEGLRLIHEATDTLEDRIAELESVEKNLLQQIQALEDIAGRVREMLLPLDVEPEQELVAA